MPLSTTITTKRMAVGLTHYQRPYGDADRSSKYWEGTTYKFKVHTASVLYNYWWAAYNENRVPLLDDKYMDVILKYHPDYRKN